MTTATTNGSATATVETLTAEALTAWLDTCRWHVAIAEAEAAPLIVLAGLR